MKKFIDFSDNKAIMINNADWILKLNYIDFLRKSVPNFLLIICSEQSVLNRDLRRD